MRFGRVRCVQIRRSGRVVLRRGVDGKSGSGGLGVVRIGLMRYVWLWSVGPGTVWSGEVS